MSGTHDSSIAGGPYRASNALACRTLADVGEATVTAARANQYVVQAPRTFPVVATSMGTSQLPEFLTTSASGTSDDSGRMVAAAKLHANKTTRLRAPSEPRPSHSLRVAQIYAAGRRAGRLDVCEWRIFQLPSVPLRRTSVSRPRESISRAPILALIEYSDVAYAD
jgi:hypothetical protein